MSEQNTLKQPDAFPVGLADIDRQVEETGDRTRMEEAAGSVTVSTRAGTFSLQRNSASGPFMIQHT